MDEATKCDALVIFGVTGDLVSKKVFTSLYELTRVGLLDIPVIGVGRSTWTTDELRANAEIAIRAQVNDDVLDTGALAGVLSRLTYVRGEYDSADTYQLVEAAVAGCDCVVMYLAVPAAVFVSVVHGIAGASLQRRSRLLIEKPFGSDLATARELAATLLVRGFANHEVFAVDHYLHKESVQNLMVLRFANRVLEPCWSARHIRAISITMSERFGVEGRAGFFDHTGTLRDVVQSHVLQVVAALAMEPPASSSATDVDAQRSKLLGEIDPLCAADVVFGQYEGYLAVGGVRSHSMTDTFVRARLTIHNDRWNGVEWMVVAGKALPANESQIVVTFREATAPGFISPECEPEPNRLTIELAPRESIVLTLQARSTTVPLGTAKVVLESSDGYRSAEELDAYARVLNDALCGDHSNFVSQQSIEQSWRIVDEVVRRSESPVIYAQGSCGPELPDR